VCVDVVDLGMVEVTYAGKTKKQHKVALVWQIDETNEETGKRFTARRRYTCSLDDKASLRKDLESWRGRPFNSDELNGFDLEVLIGVNCQINVVHESRNGETYANVTTIVPISKGMPRLSALDYARVKDRDGQNGNSSEYEASEDDVPF
jgi:hypothetical protein